MKIVNIVCSGDCKQKINLNSLFQLDPSVFSYDPEIYPGGYIRLLFCKVTLYSSGKYIFVGLKKIEDINPAFNQFKEILSRFIDSSIIEYPSLKNMVAIENFNRKINLNALSSMLDDQDIEYEPEQFPGLILKIKNNNTILIFSSGKVIFTGLKNEEDLIYSIDYLKKKLHVLPR